MDGSILTDACGLQGACTVIISRTKTPIDPMTWVHVPGGTMPWHRNATAQETCRSLLVIDPSVFEKMLAITGLVGYL